MDIIQYDEFDNVFYVEDFKQELVELKKQDRGFAKWLFKRLSMLSTNAALQTDGVRFEELDNEELYAIRRPESRFNQRVIYYIVSEDNSVILLSAFREVHGRRDYKPAINNANSRLNNLRKEGLL